MLGVLYLRNLRRERQHPMRVVRLERTSIF